MKIKKAVIPIAGLGTRFLPFSKAVPKEMLPIIDKPVIQLIIEEFVKSGIEEIVLVTSKNKRAVEDHFDTYFELEHRLEKDGKLPQLEMVRKLSKMVKIVSVRQQEALGNGHALLQAAEIIGNEPFAFSYGDDILYGEKPAISKLIEVYEKYKGTVIGTVSVPREHTCRYGVIDPKEELEEGVFEISGVVEKPEPKDAPSTLINPGRFVFPPTIFDALRKVKPGKGGEIWLIDAVELLSKSEKIYAAEMKSQYLDCGNKLEYLKACITFGLDNPELSDDLRAYLNSLSK